MATESWVVGGPQIIEVDAIAALRVQVVGGRVDVVVHDDPTETGARIEVHEVDGRPLEISLSDGELRVGYSFTLGGWDGFLDTFRYFRERDSADVHIAVPRAVAVRLGTVSAEGLLFGVRNDASVSTVSGSLVTDSTSGALVANAISGEIVVRAHAGDLRLTSVAGDLTASGDLTRVHANTVGGAVTLDVTSLTSAITASTVAGDVTVRLSHGRGVDLEARSVSGRVVIDGQEHKGATVGQVKVSQPSSGGGTCYVVCSSVTGHVTVLHATEVS